MATSPPSNTPPFHPRKRRLMLYLILTLAGIGLFSIAQWFFEISHEVSDLYNSYYMMENKNPILKRSVESLENKQFSREKHSEDLSSRVSQYEKELSYVSKQAQNLGIAINTQFQDLDKVKREMGTAENVIQSIMTSQVTDIKRHEDLWKAIKALEESSKTKMDVETAQAILKTLFTKFEEIDSELNQQKTTIEELTSVKGQHYEKMKTAFYKLKALTDSLGDFDSVKALVKAFMVKVEVLVKEIHLQKTKTEDFINTRMQQTDEIWKAILTLQSNVKNIQDFLQTVGYSQDLNRRLDTLGKEMKNQLDILEELGKENELYFTQFNKIWDDLNKLKDGAISRTDLEGIKTYVGNLNNRIESLFQRLKSQNMKIKNPDEQPLKIEEPDIPQRKGFKQEKEETEKKAKEVKKEGKESMRQKAMNVANGAMKEIGHFTKKIKGEIGKQTEKVSHQVEKVKKALFHLFG